MTVAEASAKWGVCESTIRKYILAGVVSGVYRVKIRNGYKWIIPDDLPCPAEKYAMRNAPSEKEAYILRYSGTMSIKTIAANLGISTAEVRRIFDRLDIEL